MPGWDSLQTVTAVHGAFQLVGLMLLLVMAALAGFVAWQLRSGVWPEWLDLGEYQLRSRFFEIGCAGAWRFWSSPRPWPTAAVSARKR